MTLLNRTNIRKALLFIGIIIGLICLASLTASAADKQMVFMTPINEGYTIFNSATDNFTTYTVWSNNITYLHMFTTPASNLYSRMFIEWNMSHYIPLNASIDNLSMCLYSNQSDRTANDDIGVALYPTNVSHINESTGNNLYQVTAAYSGFAITSRKTDRWWHGPTAGGAPGYENTSTDLAVDVDAPFGAGAMEGKWFKSNTGVLGGERAFRVLMEQNLTKLKDSMLITWYGMSAITDVKMMTSLNATCYPFIIVNITYNISQSNSSTFSNNSVLGTSDINASINLSNTYGNWITYGIMLYDPNLGYWQEIGFNRSVTSNSTQVAKISYANFAPNTEYFWYYYILGNSTHGPVYHFTTPPVEPPTNVQAHDYNSTTLNISFTPFSLAGTVHTICYYAEGSSCPSYGTGTLGGNVTGSWINITGLTKGTQYSFAFWTYWNNSIDSELSSNFTCITNTTSYGEVNIVLRYENMSSDGTNHMINLTKYGNSTHRLLIHYENLSEQPVLFTGYTYNASGFSANTTVTLKYKPLFYEFTWNYSVNGTNMEGTYTRVLTPYAEETTGGITYLTFYLRTDAHVYNQYYLVASNWTLEEDINDRLVEYSYIFDDRSGYFSTVKSYDSYATIYFYNNTKKIIVEERYLDSTRKIAPILMYKQQYFLGIASITNSQVNIYYDNIGLVPTERYVSPYQETIVVYPYSTTFYEMAHNITWQWSWSDYSGFAVHYNDISHKTTHLQFSVYNATNGTIIYTKWVNGTYDYNFQFTSSDTNFQNLTYNFTINYTYAYDSGKVVTFTTGNVTVYKSLNTLTLASTIESLLHSLFGDSPFYNPDTGASVSYLDTIALIVSLILLGFFASTGHPTIAIASPALWLMFMGTAIQGANAGYMVIGFFLLVLAILYALNKGGHRT